MKDKKIFYGWWIELGSAILLALLGPATVAVANIYQTSVVAEFGIANSQFALSNSIVLGMGIFFSPFIAKQLTNNFKRSYLIGVLVYATGYIGYGFTENITVFYLLSILVGLGSLTTTILPITILINNWFVNKRGLALSLAFTGLGFGGVIFSQFVTFFTNMVGWRQTYMIYGGLMLLVTIPVMLFFIKEKPEDIGLKPYGEEFYVPNKSGEEEQIENVEQTFAQSIKKPFFILLVLGSVLVGIVNNGGFGQFPPFLTSLHGGAAAATVISIYSAVGIIGKLVLGQLTDVYGVVKSTIYATSLLVITYFLMLFSSNIIIAIVMAVFFGLGNAIGTVLPPMMTSAIYSNEQYSVAYSYVNSGVQLGMTIGSVFAAGIADFTGSYNYSWMALMIISGLIAVLWIGSYKNAEKYN